MGYGPDHLEDLTTQLEQRARQLEEGDVWVTEDGRQRRQILTPCCRWDCDGAIKVGGLPLDHVQFKNLANGKTYVFTHTAFFSWSDLNRALTVRPEDHERFCLGKVISRLRAAMLRHDRSDTYVRTRLYPAQLKLLLDAAHESMN